MEGLMFYAHSGVRYLVLLSAVATVGWFFVAMLRRRTYDSASRLLIAAYTGLLDLQILFGLLLLLAIPFYGALAGHIVMMLSAAVVVHGVVIVNRNRPEERRSNGLVLLGVMVSLGLVLGGIMAIARPIVGSG